MAEDYNQANPSLGVKTKPELIGNIGTGTTWGIDNELSALTGNYIVQSESIQHEDITDLTQDQKGAVVSKLSYDQHWTLNLTFLTDSPSALDNLPGIYTFSYAGNKWSVNNVTYNGSYNQKKSYTLNAERYQHFPEQD